MHMKIEPIFSTALLCISIGLANAAEVQLPAMKDGLWESHTQQVLQGKKFEASMKICQTHEIEKSMKSAGDEMRKTNQCTEIVTQTSATSYTSESRCMKGPLAGSVTKMTYTYQGDTASHMEMHMAQGQSDNVTIIESRYLGSCPVGMKPGDAVMADGTKMNFGGK